MAQITLSKDAPKGEEVTFVFGEKTFSLSSDKPYTTDDPVLIAEARTHHLLEVQEEQGDDSTAAQEAAAADEAYAARDEFKRALAEKDPLDPAPEAPFERPYTGSEVPKAEESPVAPADNPAPQLTGQQTNNVTQKAADKAKEAKA